MRFFVERASTSDIHKPCDEAKRIIIKDGDREHKRWYINIDSLEELMIFFKKYERIIIEYDFILDKFIVIKIYDDYVES